MFELVSRDVITSQSRSKLRCSHSCTVSSSLFRIFRLLSTLYLNWQHVEPQIRLNSEGLLEKYLSVNLLYLTKIKSLWHLVDDVLHQLKHQLLNIHSQESGKAETP